MDSELEVQQRQITAQIKEIKVQLLRRSIHILGEITGMPNRPPTTEERAEALQVIYDICGP